MKYFSLPSDFKVETLDRYKALEFFEKTDHFTRINREIIDNPDESVKAVFQDRGINFDFEEQKGIPVSKKMEH